MLQGLLPIAAALLATDSVDQDRFRLHSPIAVVAAVEIAVDIGDSPELDDAQLLHGTVVAQTVAAAADAGKGLLL